MRQSLRNVLLAFLGLTVLGLLAQIVLHMG